MNNKKMVSIVVPVYNVEKYIKKCVNSLINQTLVNIEIILIDDGSTDSSGKICDEYMKIDSRVKVIHKSNEGLGLARNAGIEIAVGDYIGFVDSDDFVSVKMFETLLKNAENYNADISYCDKIKWFGNGAICEVMETNDVIVYEKEDIKQYLLNRIGMPPEFSKDTLYQTAVWLGIYKHDIIKKKSIRFVSERDLISEDIIFNIDIIKECKCIVHSNSQFYYYRYTINSLTSKYKKERFSQNVVMYKELKKKLSDIYTDKEISLAIDRYLITYARIACIQEVEFEKINGVVNTKKRIESICNNPEIINVLGRYPYKKLPLKYALLCHLMRYKKYKLIIYVLNARRKI